LGGALFLDDFISLAKKCGFRDVRKLKLSPIDVTDPELAKLCGAAKFFSITFRLFKFDNEEIFEDSQQDFGQIAILKDTTGLDSSFQYRLDDEHLFEINRPMLISGNTACILQSSWLKNHFLVIGDRTNHFGSFSQQQQLNTKNSTQQKKSAAVVVQQPQQQKQQQDNDDDDESC
jgi:arsenite methyltransferase